MPPTLHQSLLMVTDLDSSLIYYRDVIGLETGRVEGSNVEFETGDSTLVLEEDFEEDTLESFGITAPGSPRGEGVIVAIEVDDPSKVDAVCSRVDKAGYPVRMESREVPWGRRMAIVADPDAYLLEISSPL